MKDRAVELRRTASEYQATLEKMAQVQEGLASEIARLADESPDADTIEHILAVMALSVVGGAALLAAVAMIRNRFVGKP